METGKAMLAQRVCGSPAKGAYAHVDAACLDNSPTAAWWRQWKEAGGVEQHMAIHLEQEADYDGLAVTWGVGNKMPSAWHCGDACRRHVPGTVPGTILLTCCQQQGPKPQSFPARWPVHRSQQGLDVVVMQQQCPAPQSCIRR